MNLSQEELLKSVENSDSSNSVSEKLDEGLRDLNRSIAREVGFRKNRLIKDFLEFKYHYCSSVIAVLA